MIAESFHLPDTIQRDSQLEIYKVSIKKNTPKGVLCKYSNSLELTFTKL